MNIRERTVIERPAAEVWPFIITPEHFIRWNDKVLSMEAEGSFRLNQPFVTHYRWGRRELQCQTLATAIEEGRMLELRHTNCIGSGIRRDMEVVERVTLQERSGRTTVTKDVIIKNHDVPWPIIPLIWCITRFGRPAGKDRLKEMCEQNL